MAVAAGTVMLDRRNHAFYILVVLFIASAVDAIKCRTYFRRGESAPKTDKEMDCESSSCCFTARINHNNHVFQFKGCDSDDVEDEMIIYAPALGGKAWESVMEACLSNECRVYGDLFGGRGESYLCGCGTDLCNEESFETTFHNLRNEANNRTASEASESTASLLWVIGGSAAIRLRFS